MDYSNNIGKFLIDKRNQQGCFIGYYENGIYRCTSWQPAQDIFRATIQTLQDSGFSVSLNAEEVANDSSFVIQATSQTSESGFENLEIPVGAVDGVNANFSLSYSYKPGSLMVYEDGLLLAPEGNDFVESSVNGFSMTNPPPNGTLILVQAVKQ